MREDRVTQALTARYSRRTLATTAGKLGAAGAAAAVAGGRFVRPAGAQDTLRIAFSVPGLNFPFFIHMMNEAEEAANEIGGIEFIRLDGQNDPNRQTADMEAMITQGVDGIVISPIDANAMGPALEAVLEAGIPIVTVDRNVPGLDTLAHVGADNVEGGRIQGRYIQELLPDGGTVFELRGQPGATPAIDRDAGLKEVLEESPEIEIVFDQTANFDTAEAVRVTEDGITAQGVPDVIVAANDDMALGASEVAQDQGLEVPIIGFDALPDALRAIEAGTMAATIEQFPGEQAARGLQIVVDFIREGTEPDEHDVFLTPALITAENISEAERAAEAGVGGEATPEA